jgi:hypothetical protein
MHGLVQAAGWPPLPERGFIVNRAATQADVAAGNAVFSAEAGDAVIGKPLRISIPQYAYHHDGGKRIAVMVVQAEEARGKKLVGARELNGQELVGFLDEFELLGASPAGAP